MDKTFADELDGLIISGGCVDADKLRGEHMAVAFVRALFDQGKPVVAI